jgi:predicted transcriptional regulator
MARISAVSLAATMERLGTFTIRELKAAIYKDFGSPVSLNSIRWRLNQIYKVGMIDKSSDGYRVTYTISRLHADLIRQFGVQNEN